MSKHWGALTKSKSGGKYPLAGPCRASGKQTTRGRGRKVAISPDLWGKINIFPRFVGALAGMKRLARRSGRQMWGCSEHKEETAFWLLVDTSLSDSGENKAPCFHWLAKEEVHLSLHLSVWSAVNVFKNVSFQRFPIERAAQSSVGCTLCKTCHRSANQPLVMSQWGLMPPQRFAVGGCKGRVKHAVFGFRSSWTGAFSNATVIRKSILLNNVHQGAV